MQDGHTLPLRHLCDIILDSGLNWEKNLKWNYYRRTRKYQSFKTKTMDNLKRKPALYATRHSNIINLNY